MTQPALVREFLEHRRILFSFIFSLTRDFDVAEEVFQEVSVAILDEASRGTEVARFLAWARELARHRVADHFRRARREFLSDGLGGLVDRAFAEFGGTPEADRLRHKALLECLEKLPPRSRELIDRRYRRRSGFESIAAAVGWTLAAVKAGLSKARKALGECVRAKLKEENP